MKEFLMVLILVSSSLAQAGEEKSALKVTVLGAKDRPHSTVMCALFEPGPGFPMDASRAIKGMDATATKDSSVYECDFEVVVGKFYAVSVAHDENGNRKLDTNLFGAPVEGWATSNDVSHTFRAPNFEESKFMVTEKNQNINVRLHY